MKGMSSVLETQADALRVLLVGGSPQTCDAVSLKHLYAGCDLVVAVDRGLDAVLDAGLPCDLFCGDADSVGARGLLAVRRCEEGEPSEVFAVERYDPYKDFTDLSLALPRDRFALGERRAGVHVPDGGTARSRPRSTWLHLEMGRPGLASRNRAFPVACSGRARHGR